MSNQHTSREFCVRCDKSLSKQESTALTELERRYSFLLCSRCLKKERREIDAIIADLSGIEEQIICEATQATRPM